MELNAGTLYDLNKQAYNSMEPYDFFKLKNLLTKIANDMFEHKYWMFLGWDHRYFTVFNLSENASKVSIAEDLNSCFEYLGKVIDYTRETDTCYEIWIRNENGENNIYKLFECGNFIFEE